MEEVESPATEVEEPQEELRKIAESTNLALEMDEEVLREIGVRAKEGFDHDIQSRQHWEECLKEWTDLAMQVREEKTWPWPGASNVKYPLLSTAAMQFNARSYPALVPAATDIVKVEVIGADPTGEKLERAKRVGDFMSYQLLHEMDGWEEDMDRLLIVLPIVGTVFKKTYYNSVKKKNESCLVMPTNLVVNYWAKSLEDAERISEILEMSPRVVKGKQKSGIYREVELPDPTTEFLNEPNKQAPTRNDGTVPYQIVEQHTYWDKDGDGYEEPYIVTFERSSGEVLRMVARFDEEGIRLNAEGSVGEIEPIQYYTKYSFVPNPDGGFYDIGFGVLLGPINESINTLINQLIDSGTLSNLQAGFLGKGLKLKMGESKWTPGEWKTVQTTADDLRKQIVPLPAKDPSNVLFQLMGSLITSGKELASVAEIFTGKMPGQNTPATTTMATVEQGMKVFTAVYKRVFRALKSEFKKLYTLNRVYLDPEKYQAVVDSPIMPEDFDNMSYDICPGADPNAASQQEKMMKAQGLLEMAAGLPGVLDIVEVVRRVLEAQEQPNYEKLFSQAVQQSGQVPPQPDPKMMEMQMKSQMEQQKIGMQAQAQQQKMELEARSTEQKLQMESQAHAQEMQHKAQMAQVESAAELHKQRIFMAQSAADGQQKLVQNAQQHEQKMQQAKEQQKSKPQPSGTSSGTGKATPSRKVSSKS